MSEGTAAIARCAGNAGGRPAALSPHRASRRAPHRDQGGLSNVVEVVPRR